jgi:hypothetical protein
MGFWMAGLLSEGMRGLEQAANAKKDLTPQLVAQAREMEHQIERLTLLNQALWELLRDRVGLTDQDFENMVREIDLRDGVPDGRITNTPMKCPQCGRVSASKHYRCLYCGLEFQKPAVG